jgi:hypothetical protein
LEQARENVNRARANTVSARERLDAFLARHFEDQALEAAPADGPEPSQKIKTTPDPHFARLKARLDELAARRRELLGYLTEEHPEVIEIDARMATLEEEVVILGGESRGGDSQGGASAEAPGDEITRRWRDYVRRQTQLRQQDAAEFQKLYEAWQAAERELAGALAVENEAAAQWETSEAAEVLTPPSNAREELTTSEAGGGADQPPPAAAVSEPGGTSAARPAVTSESGGSQPLVLAALLIALAVAALAAVKLARTTADPIFTSADEVAAALAIPVVGIIPAAAARAAGAPTRSRRKVPLAVQLLLAVSAFAVAAFLVQNLDSASRMVDEAVQALSSVTRAIGGK